MSEFVADGATVQEETALELPHGARIVLPAQHSPQKINTSFQWTMAATRWMEVVCSVLPEKREPLCKYIQVVTKLFHTHGFPAGCLYDAEWRKTKLTAAYDGKFDALDLEVFAVCVVARQQQQPQRQPFGRSPRFPPHPNGAPVPQSSGGGHLEVCRNWNASRCFRSNCPRLHQCSLCAGPHPAASCPAPPRLPAATRPSGPLQPGRA